MKKSPLAVAMKKRIGGNDEIQKVMLTFNSIMLQEGNYYMSFYIKDEENIYLDYIKYGIILHVVSGKKNEDGIVSLKHKWEVIDLEEGMKEK